jgi:replicative DNA helicase
MAQRQEIIANLEAERALLGSMLLDSEVADSAISKISEESFFDESHRLVFKAIQAVRAQGGAVDSVTVLEALRTAGTLDQVTVERADGQQTRSASAISVLGNWVPNVEHWEDHLKIVAEKAARRKVRDLLALAATQNVIEADLRRALETIEKARAETAAIVEGRELLEYETEVVRLSDIEPEEVRWLWKPYIPSRKMTILAGPPGVGKTFLTLAVITAITTGKPLPDQEGKTTIFPTPGDVLYLGNEDDAADTLRPRIDAMGGNADRIWLPKCLKHRRTRQKKAISLLDVDALRSAIEQYQARLVVVDPVQAFIGGANIDMNNRQHISLVLSDIGELAKECDTAFLLVMHLNKGARDRTLDKVSGSGEFTSKVRSVLFIGRDPDNPNLRVMAQEKMSVAKEGASVRFSLDGGAFEWAGTSTVSATEMLQPDSVHTEKRTKLEEATEWLRDRLSDGVKYNGEELLREGESADMARRTLRRAAQELGVIIERERGARGRWFWSLPGDTQNTLTL